METWGEKKRIKTGSEKDKKSFFILHVVLVYIRAKDKALVNLKPKRSPESLPCVFYPFFRIQNLNCIDKKTRNSGELQVLVRVIQ
ncbi:MAG: hypothetical protein EA393_10045 [Bacteroidetes bacterium]|nr:MAG: hypothetical protein EA393_10045 [Bacteroidota bacterium]